MPPGSPVYAKPSNPQLDVSLFLLLWVLVLLQDMPRTINVTLLTGPGPAMSGGIPPFGKCLPIVLSPGPWPSYNSEVPDLTQEAESHKQEAVDYLGCVGMSEQIPHGNSSIWGDTYDPLQTPTGLFPVPGTLMVLQLPCGKRALAGKSRVDVGL